MPRYLILTGFFSAFKTPQSGRFSLVRNGSSVAILPALLVLLFSWLQPLHFLPWVSWHSEVLAFFAMLLLAGCSLYGTLKKDRSGLISLPMTALPLIVLGLVAAVQAATGLITFSGDALVFGFYMMLCVMCLMMGYACSRQSLSQPELLVGGDGRVAVTVLASALVVGAFASAVLAFAQIFELWESASWISRMPELRRPGGNLGQPNQLATLLIMGVASLLFLYETRKLTALPSVLILLTLFVGMAATESRTGVLSFFMLLLWWFAKRGSVGFKLSPWLVALSGLGFLSLFWAWPMLMTAMQTLGAGAEVNTTAGMRWVVWPQLLEALSLRPWSGWGIGRVSDAHNAVAHAYAVSEPFTYSHNIVLDLALGVGLPLAGLLLLLVSVWLWRRGRSARALLPWYCLAAALPVAVHSMLEFPFAYAYFLVPVMFLLGTLEAASGARPLLRIRVWPAALLLLVTSAVMAWSVVEYVAIEEDFRIVRFEAMRIGQTPPSYQRPKVVLLTQLDALLNGGRIVPQPGMAADELDLARKVALRFPWPATQNRYALSLALNGYPDDAVRQLRVMRALHGEKNYAQIKEAWVNLANEKYPQLHKLKLP